MVFSDIEVVLMTKGDWGGERETIISLSAKDRFSYLQAYLPSATRIPKILFTYCFKRFPVMNCILWQKK